MTKPYKVKESDNKARVAEIREALKVNGGYCPCQIMQNEDTRCMCKEFKEQISDPEFFGTCHCGLYEKAKLTEMKELYKVTTTFLGADRPSDFYFDNADKAETFLAKQINGEITKVRVTAEYLNYSDGCTYNDLVYGKFQTSVEEEIKR